MEGEPIVFGNPQWNNSFWRKSSLALMQLNHGVIVEVLDASQARIAQYAGAKAVLVMANRNVLPHIITEVKRAVNIPVMIKVPMGQAGLMSESIILADFVEEISVGNMHFNKHDLNLPTMSECMNVNQVLNRLNEGATLIRFGGCPEQWENCANVRLRVSVFRYMSEADLFAYAVNSNVPHDLLGRLRRLGCLPILMFASGRIHTAADAAMMRRIGCNGVIVSLDVWFLGRDVGRIIREIDACRRIQEIVLGVMHFDNDYILAQEIIRLRRGW